MQLVDVIQDIVKKSITASAPTELTVGTVSSASPLEIVTQTNMQVLRAPVLYLTTSVVEKKLTGLSGAVCYENGAALPAGDEEVILNRALAAGDKVLLLRVLGGQMFVILSRIY